ncbi:MAG: GerMN domain-containing protein, partial [Acidimicrobiia bacterium]
TTTSTSPPVVEVAIPVFFVGGARLVQVERRVAAPATLEQSFFALMAGVNDEEAVRGLRSAVPPGTRMRSVRLEGGVARVDLSLELAQGFGSEQMTALAQIVYTATGYAGVTGVRFVIEGQEIDVPAGDGILTAAPLGRDAYLALAPS